MEVDQDTHTGPGCPLADFYGCVNVVVAAAITLSVGVIGIIPDADPDIVDAAGSKQVKKALVVQFISLKIVIVDAAVLLGYIGGYVHAADEIIIDPVYVIHFDSGLDRIRGIHIAWLIGVPSSPEPMSAISCVPVSAASPASVRVMLSTSPQPLEVRTT